ncbi:hypothetical protein [Labrenzia sp. DG1229]|uniref:hypothetical protein n=1 Tax=Labrenzia sp. DG1229 TaxID=681847 RepID=UPI00048F6E14|nr:hypothetical protein [Labrenzia sp. DG1229]
MRKRTEPQYAASLPDRRQLEVIGIVKACYHIPAPAARSKDDFTWRRIQKTTESNTPPRNDAETTEPDTVREAGMREIRTRAFTA